MEKSDLHETVVLIMTITIPVILLTIILGAYLKETIIGARVTQFMCVALLVPAIIILAFEDVLQGETVGTLLGGISGFVLSNVGKYEKKKTDKPKEK